MLFSVASIVLAAVWNLGEVSVELPAKPRATQKQAAAELTHHLELITGGPCSVAAGVRGTADATERVPPRIVLGRAPKGEPAAKPFESHAKLVGNDVYLWGDDTAAYPGTLYAAYGFLAQRLGVTWAYPGEDGIVFTRRQTVELPDGFHDVFSPRYDLGKFRGGGNGWRCLEYSDKIPAGLRWSRKDALADSAMIDEWHGRMRLWSREQFEYGHAFTQWQDRFLKTHPEYLSLRDDGSRTGIKWPNPTTTKLCVSNPDVVDQIIADWVAAGKPRYLNICENDGFNYCVCPKCKALDTDQPGENFNANKTDRYLWFWNRIAEKARAIRPDVKCVTYIYSSYRHPPRRERIEYGDNMLFGIVPTFADDIEAFIGEWAKAGLKRFFLRPNFHCAYTVLPRGVEKRIYDVYRYCCAHGLEGVDFDSDFNRYPLRPENYVTCRMIADPEGSFEDFMRDYCAAFGEAAPEVAEYCARIRARADRVREEVAKDAFKRNFLDDTQMARYQLKHHSEADLQADKALLERAAAKSFTSPEAKKRVADLLVAAEHYILTYRFMMAYADKDNARLQEAARKLLVFRLLNQKTLKDVYGMNMAGNWKGLENHIWRSIGYPKEFKVSEFGFDPDDSTRFLQAALDSGAKRVIVDRQATPWISTPLFGRSDTEVVFEDGAEILAKKGEFRDPRDQLLTFANATNVVVRGLGEKGGILRMRRDEYLDKANGYKRSEWRHALNLLGSENVTVEKMSMCESGGDGVYVSVAYGTGNPHGCRNVTLRDCVMDRNNRQGVSVISVDGLLMERCTMSNTAGALPMAGIDFEPNMETEPIRNVVMRDCRTVNNRGNGYELAFMALSRKSRPVSLTLENCTSEGDALGVYFNGGNYKEKGYVSGEVTLRNCTIVEPRGYPGIGVRVQRPVSTSFVIDGGRCVKDGVTETLDAAWLKAHYPLLVLGARIADAKVPAFAKDSVAVDPAPGEMRKLAALCLRNESCYALYANAARRVRFTGHVTFLKAWGKVPENPVVIRDAAGREVAKLALPPAGKSAELAFDAPEAGFYTMDVNPGHHGFTLTEADCPVAVDFAKKQADVMSSVGKTYFHVPAQKGDFAIYVASGGAGENVGVKVVDAKGTCVLADPTVVGWQVCAGGADAPSGLWTLELSAPAKGRFEDYMLDMAGIPGALFLSSDRYWKSRE